MSDINIMHYNREKQTYKVFEGQILRNEGREPALLISMREGEKGNQASRHNLSIALNKQEIAYLILELQKLYNIL